MIDKLPAVIKVLWYGHRLRHARAWSDIATAVAALTPAFMLLLSWAQSKGWLFVGMSEQEVSEMANSIALVVMPILAYLFQATNKDAGFRSGEPQLPPLSAPTDERPLDYSTGGVLDGIWFGNKHRLHEDDE